MKLCANHPLFQGLEKIPEKFPSLGTFRVRFSKPWKKSGMVFPILGKTGGFLFQSLEMLVLGCVLLTVSAAAPVVVPMQLPTVGKKARSP